MNTPTTLLAAAVLAFALPAAAAPDFDAGLDASALLTEAKAGAAAATAVEAQSSFNRRTTRDCATIVFRPGSPTVSEAVWLSSTEWVVECYPTGGDPRRGGGGRTCHERPGYTYRERVQITLRERLPLLPWEEDAFRVCLDGPFLDTDQLESAYEYTRAGYGRDGNITVAPVRKTPMRPDPAGVSATIAPNLAVALADRWASYYAGERVVIKLTLKKHVPNWFDPVVLEKEVELPVAASYAVELAAEAAAAGARLEAGKSYYAVYAVKRVGPVSRPVFTRGLETNKAAYAPAAALASN